MMQVAPNLQSPLFNPSLVNVHSPLANPYSHSMVEGGLELMS